MVKKLQLNINMSNRIFYSFILLGGILLLGVVVYAYGGSEPAVMEHSEGEIEENDPTVLDSVKNGVSWDEVTGKPAGFADDVDNTGGTINYGNCYVRLGRAFCANNEIMHGLYAQGNSIQCCPESVCVGNCCGDGSVLAFTDISACARGSETTSSNSFSYTTSGTTYTGRVESRISGTTIQTKANLITPSYYRCDTGWVNGITAQCGAHGRNIYATTYASGTYGRLEDSPSTLRNSWM